MMFLRMGVGLLLLCPSLAWATIGSVSGAVVDKGVTTVQMRNAYGTDNEQTGQDKRWRSRIGVDYGFTDSYAAGLYVQGDRRENDNMELEAIILDQRVEIHTAKKDGFYSGFRVRYTKRDGDKTADDMHLRLILGKPVGNWDLRFNQLFTREVGADRVHGVLLESRGHVSYGLGDGYRVGMESLNQFGKANAWNGFNSQQHEIGPVFIGKLNGMTYDISYRQGISDAATDHVVRLVLLKSF